MREAISITLESALIEKIRSSKGKNEPISRYLEDIIAEHLAKTKKGGGKN